jgi:hypothetical protein
MQNVAEIVHKFRKSSRGLCARLGPSRALGPRGPRDEEAAGNVVRGTTFVKLGLSVLFRLPRLISTAVINKYRIMIHNRVSEN